MAEVVESMPEGRTRPDKSSQWDEWLDGRVWRIVRGVDTQMKDKSFRTAACDQARIRKMRATVRVTDEYFYVQAIPKS